MIQLTEEELKNYLETVHSFQKEFSDINQRYKTNLNLKALENNLDTLCVDINSDGIDFFVEYHGNHLRQTKKAMEELGIHNGVHLLADIQEKRKRHIEDFKTEEDFYYKFVEKDLLEGLYTYVINHKSRFR